MIAKVCDRETRRDSRTALLQEMWLSSSKCKLHTFNFCMKYYIMLPISLPCTMTWWSGECKYKMSTHFWVYMRYFHHGGKVDYSSDPLFHWSSTESSLTEFLGLNIYHYHTSTKSHLLLMYMQGLSHLFLDYIHFQLMYHNYCKL